MQSGMLIDRLKQSTWNKKCKLWLTKKHQRNVIMCCYSKCAKEPVTPKLSKGYLWRNQTIWLTLLDVTSWTLHKIELFRVLRKSVCHGIISHLSEIRKFQTLFKISKAFCSVIGPPASRISLTSPSENSIRMKKNEKLNSQSQYSFTMVHMWPLELCSGWSSGQGFHSLINYFHFKQFFDAFWHWGRAWGGLLLPVSCFFGRFLNLVVWEMFAYVCNKTSRVTKCVNWMPK